MDFCLDFVWLWPNICGRERRNYLQYIHRVGLLGWAVRLDWICLLQTIYSPIFLSLSSDPGSLDWILVTSVRVWETEAGTWWARPAQLCDALSIIYTPSMLRRRRMFICLLLFLESAFVLSMHTFFERRSYNNPPTNSSLNLWTRFLLSTQLHTGGIFIYLLCRHEIKPLFPTFWEYLGIIHNFSSSPFKVTVNCHSKQNTKHTEQTVVVLATMVSRFPHLMLTMTTEKGTLQRGAARDYTK